MCNGRKHPAGCDCGFGPPYPGKIEQVEKIEWIDEAIDRPETFKKGLRDLNFDPPTFNSFVREYNSIQELPESKATKRQKLESLVDSFEYREESSELVPIKVPLFKLHSPSTRKARVIYREPKISKEEKGWLVKVFSLGMGSTNTYRVIYDPEFISKNGECLEVFVPLILNVKLIGVYDKKGTLQSRGIQAEIEGAENEGTLRKRGCETLPKDECADKTALGKYSVQKYVLSGQHRSKKGEFKQNFSLNVARVVELHVKEVFGYSIKPVANIEHQHELELLFELPGSHDYSLCYSSTGLHWDVT